MIEAKVSERPAAATERPGIEIKMVTPLLLANAAAWEVLLLNSARKRIFERTIPAIRKTGMKAMQNRAMTPWARSSHTKTVAPEIKASSAATMKTAKASAVGPGMFGIVFVLGKAPGPAVKVVVEELRRPNDVVTDTEEVTSPLEERSSVMIET